MDFINKEIAEEYVSIVPCRKCKEAFTYTNKDIKIHYHVGYETKTVQCSCCKSFNIIGHRTQYGFDVNNDTRFYKYK